MDSHTPIAHPTSRTDAIWPMGSASISGMMASALGRAAPSMPAKNFSSYKVTALRLYGSRRRSRQGCRSLPNGHRILVIDEIRLMSMVQLWRDLRYPKSDATTLGHWSGIGLVK